MIHNQFLRFYSITTFILSCTVLLVGCNVSSQPEMENTLVDNQEVVTIAVERSEYIVTVTPIGTTHPTPTIRDQQTAVLVPTTTVTGEFTEYPLSTDTPLPLATPTVSSTLTSTPTPTPAILPPACSNLTNLPKKAFPREIDIANAHIAVDGTVLYLAVESYIGVFDISHPVSPNFMGFWELPDLPKIKEFRVHHGVAYVRHGTTVHLLNLSQDCQFTSIATIDMLSEVFHVEVERNKVYIGGILGGQNLVVIFDVSNASQPKELSRVEFGSEPTIWSVWEDNLYSLRGDNLFVTDVSNLDTLSTQPVNIELDPSLLSRAWIDLIGDKLYLLSEADGLWILSNLKDTSPNLHVNPQQYILIGIFEIQKKYIFLGYLGCEGGEIDCSSLALILDADSAEQLSSISFDPHGDIFHYKEVQDGFLYAFSNESLIVVDISNIDNPVIMGHVSLGP